MAQAVDESQVASAFLQEIGAPDTPEMRRAVTAWLRKESGRSIIGNNPWNISLGASRNLGITPCGERAHSRTGQKFAVYCNITDGTRAAARLLLGGANKGDWRNYQAVINGARSGDPIAFLNGLASSAWSADRYGGPTNNSLIGVYKSVSGFRGLLAGPSGERRAGASAIPSLGAFGDLVKFPVGHILTQTDVDSIMKILKDSGFFAKDFPSPFGILEGEGTAAQATRAILTANIGKPWNKSLQDQLAEQFGVAAEKAAKPFGELPELGNLVDPGFWARILALLAGIGLVGFGIIRLATR